MPVTYIETRDVPADQLTRYPGNARRGDTEAIRASIRRHGQYRALVVRDTGDQLVILAGNHTYDALQAEGHTVVRAEILACDNADGRRINLADNRLAELGGYDDQALAELLEAMNGDLDGTGYNDKDLDALLAGVTELPPALSDPDNAPEPPAEPFSKPGDLWQLGPHRLLCGDATNPAHLDQVTAGLEVSIVYTDPPYGISIVKGQGNVGGYDPSSRGKVGGGGPFRGKNGNGQVIPSSNYLPVAGDGTTDVARDAFALVHSVYPQARHVWWGGNHYAGSAELPDSSCWLVWDKDNTGNFADCELAWTNHPGAVRLFRHMWNGMLRASERGKRVHPTQKPVALAEWAFGVVDPDVSRRVVLDVFGGSGSTLIAAHATGRTAAVVEMEPHYVDVICRRYQEHTGTLPVLASTGEAHDFARDSANQ